MPSTAAAMARMCSGRVPQQPPTTFSQPARAKSRRMPAMCSGVSSYWPNSFGRPAFGKHIVMSGVRRASSSTYGRMSSAPRAQLMLTANRSTWAIEL